jgi:hypothetical protein
MGAYPGGVRGPCRGTPRAAWRRRGGACPARRVLSASAMPTRIDKLFVDRNGGDDAGVGWSVSGVVQQADGVGRMGARHDWGGGLSSVGGLSGAPVMRVPFRPSWSLTEIVEGLSNVPIELREPGHEQSLLLHPRVLFGRGRDLALDGDVRQWFPLRSPIGLVLPSPGVHHRRHPLETIIGPRRVYARGSPPGIPVQAWRGADVPRLARLGQGSRPSI